MENNSVRDRFTTEEWQFHSLADHIPDPIARFNKKLQFIYVNNTFLRNVGLEASEIIGKTNQEIGFPPLDGSLSELLKKVFETGEPAEIQGASLRGKAEVYMVTKIVPERNKQGEIETLLAIGRDTTALKEAELEIVRLKEEVEQKVADKYYSIFNSIDEGFCIFEIVYDESDKATDYRFVEVNPAFERQTGLRDVIGKTGKELMPVTADLDWIELYDKVVKTGEPIYFENYQEGTGRWYHVRTSKVGKGNSLVAAVFKDITHHKRLAEEDALLSEISKDLVELDHIAATMKRIGEKIGGHFGVEWCVFSERRSDTESFSAFGWNTSDVCPLNGQYRVKDHLSEEQIMRDNAGEPTIVRDTHTDPEVNAEHYAVIGIRSFITIPLSRDGQWQFRLAVISTRARNWKPEEIGLLKELAGRIWTKVEKARIEETLRINEEQMRGLKEAFQSVVDGATMASSLRIITDIVVNETSGAARTAFYIADRRGECLNTIRGAGNMPDEYADRIDGFLIGEDSLASGVAIPTGREVITPDVRNEPLWKPWLPIAEEFDYRGCWSFAIKTEDNKAIGTFVMYFREPREALPQDLALADLVTQAAAVIICNQIEKQQRARAEKAMRESEQKYRMLFDAMDVGYCIIQMIYDDAGKAVDWIFLHVNKAFETNNGLADAEGKTICQLAPDIEPKWMEIYDHVAQSGEPLRFDEDSIALGRNFSLYAFRTDDPSDRKVVVLFTDITERKMAEGVLRNSELRLQQLVAGRTEELQRSNEDLRQFAHVASHDLKEPVRKIRTFNNRIKTEFGHDLPEKVNTYVDKIGNAADRMLSMIDGVLAYSKIDDLYRQTELVDLGLIMEEIASDLELMILQKNAKIVAENLPIIAGSQVLIHQLFYNLVLNSLKFAKTNVPSLITIKSKEVIRENQPFFEITVSDNGIGFENAYADRIFTSFTRLHPADEYEGTGLGLALCKKIVLRHHGFISAVGLPDRGAIFTILLP